MEKNISKSHCTLDLDQTLHNIELARDIFLNPLHFEFTCKTHALTRTHAHTHTDEYSIVGKNNNNETIITEMEKYRKYCVKCNLCKSITRKFLKRKGPSHPTTLT